MDGMTLEACERKVKEKLAKQEKVTVFLPGDRPFWEGTINGLNLLIKTNQYVQVPKDVAKLIENNAALLRESEEAVKSFCGELKKIATM